MMKFIVLRTFNTNTHCINCRSINKNSKLRDHGNHSKALRALVNQYTLYLNIKMVCSNDRHHKGEIMSVKL